MLPGDVQDTAVLPESTTGQASPEPVEPAAPEFVSRTDFDTFIGTVDARLRQYFESLKQSQRDTTKDRVQQELGPVLREVNRVTEWLQPLLSDGTDMATIKQQLATKAMLDYFGQHDTTQTQSAAPQGTAIPQGPPDWLIAEANSLLAENGLTGNEPEIQQLHAEGRWTPDERGYARYLRDLEITAQKAKAGKAVKPAPPAPPAQRPAGAAAAVDIGQGQGVAGRSLDTVTLELNDLMRTNPRDLDGIRKLKEEHGALLKRENVFFPQQNVR